MTTFPSKLLPQLFRSRLADSPESRGEIAKWFRCCAICECFLPPIDLLCGRCRRKLFAIAEPAIALKPTTGLPFPIRTILEWTPANEPLVQPLLHGFKGGTSTRLATELALILIGTKRLKKAVFVPAPSSKKDHAFLLASVCAELFQFEVVRALEAIGDMRRQRDKSKEERQTRRFQIKPDMVNLVEQIIADRKAIIFIDDVITTGATVSAAFEAFGRPKNFEAWSLARRPRLAGPDRF